MIEPMNYYLNELMNYECRMEEKQNAIQSILDKKENLQEEIDKLLSSEEIWNERLSDDINDEIVEKQMEIEALDRELDEIDEILADVS
ncbi:hypothetical protein DXA62_12515 [Coprobacillus sp. OF03-2AA]|uniref:hypothetical protein n=1 Tax=Faecalibacillus intestinalis TaxID=1982626 RepID=UPI000E55224C|nr:hypothetical protein [Faecalibacillus intestinalis]RHP70480.1 hypothetical protein DXA62_12515 [Coprobacillus sp. OF03-2AA]